MHRIILSEDKKLRNCAFCQLQEVKNKSGGCVRTRNLCEACNVPLCRGQLTDRNCFQLYHDFICKVQQRLSGVKPKAHDSSSSDETVSKPTDQN